MLVLSAPADQEYTAAFAKPFSPKEDGIACMNTSTI